MLRSFFVNCVAAKSRSVPPALAGADGHKRVWDELNYAWLATFSCSLHTVRVERWPKTGPFAFTPESPDQSNWLTNTLLFTNIEKWYYYLESQIIVISFIIPIIVIIDINSSIVLLSALWSLLHLFQLSLLL